MKQNEDSLHKYCKKRMNYLNDSGEFHEVESNFSGKCSHVPSQPARISSPRSMLIGIHLDYRKTFFSNPRSTLESLQIPYQGTHPSMTSSAAGQAPALISTGRPVAKRG